MKIIEVFLIAYFVCLLSGCYQEISYDEIFPEVKTRGYLIPEEPFQFHALMQMMKNERVPGTKEARYLDSAQMRVLNMTGQAILNISRDLSRMCWQLYQKGIRIKCAVGFADEDIVKFNLRDKDAYYNPSSTTIVFKDLHFMIDDRVIIHELLHVFQQYLVNIDFTENNELYNEFEVAFIGDILQYTMRGEAPWTLEGGDVKGEYGTIIWSIVQDRLAAVSKIEFIVKEFRKFYKLKYPGSTEPENYYPSLLVHFLCNIG